MEQHCNQHEQLVNAVYDIKEKLNLVWKALQGDISKGIPGMCEQIREMRKELSDLRTQRDMVVKSAWSVVLRLIPWLVTVCATAAATAMALAKGVTQ